MIERKSEIAWAGRTAGNLGSPAVGLRLPHLRRLTSWGRRRCGNPWTLYDMVAAKTGPSAVLAAGKLRCFKK